MGAITGPSDYVAEQVAFLKKQINQLIQRYQPLTDQAKELSQDLKKLDLETVGKSLQKMNENISQNLKTIIADQQAKLAMLEKIDVQQVGEEEDTKSALSGLLKVLDLIMSIASFVSFAFASNPITMAFEGLLIAFDSILNMWNFLNNIKQYQELRDKYYELQNYFAWGGEFQQNLKKISEGAYQLVENFFMFIVGFNGMMQELTINVNLLAIQNKSKKINITKHLNFLKKNPINPVVLLDFQNLYKNLLSIRAENPYKRIGTTGKYIQDFQQKYDLSGLVKKMKDICDQFQNDSDIGKAIGESSSSLKELTSLKGRFQAKFEKRKTVKPQDLPKFDKNLFEDMLDDGRKFENPQLTTVQVVSFYTTEFFADDPTGKTLLKYDLKELFAKTESLNCLGTNSSGQNIIYLHNPSGSSQDTTQLTSLWDAIKQKLKKKYLQEKKVNDCEIQKFYMRMQTGSFTINGQSKSKLNFYYGIRIKTQGLGDFYEKLAEQCTEEPHAQKFVQKPRKVSHYEDESTDLTALCKYMSFYINVVAYPERVIKFSIFKQENLFKATLSWDSVTIKQEHFGKLIQCRVKKISEQKQQTVQAKQKEDIFYEQTFANDDSIVAFVLS